MTEPARRLKVALLIDRFEPERGGAERALALLARALAVRGHTVLAVAARHAARHIGADAAPVLVRPRALTPAGRERALAAALVDAAGRARADVTVGVRHLERIDLYWPHGGLHAEALAARDAADGRPAAPPSRRSRRQRLYLELERGLLGDGRARAVACVSRAIEREIEAAYPAARARLHVHENGVDLARFQPGLRSSRGGAVRARLGAAPGVVVLVLAARDVRLKGLPLAVEALAGLTELPWLLWIAGASPRRAWAAAARLPRGRVRVDERADAEDLWAAADLAVQPTWRDPCSLATLEALASGVPVLTTPANGAADAIASPAAGELVACGDARALCEVLGRWIERAAGGRVEREAARQGVLGRGQDAWLAGLVARIEALAG